MPTELRQIVAALAESEPRCGQTRLVCIDGPAGSGKSTLAAALAPELGGAVVVGMDDLYEGWEQPLGEPLSARVEAWLLLAWAAGLPGKHLRYDWATGGFERWVTVPAGPVAILEGCGSAARRIRQRASLVIWVQAPPAMRLRRGLDRDGHALHDQWLAWQRREAAHFDADRTRQSAHIVVSGETGRVASRRPVPRH